MDVVDCSSGGLVPYAKIAVGPGYQVGFAARVRSAGVMTAAVGMITAAAQAEAILVEGQADLIVMARQMLRDPYFPLHAADELGFSDIIGRCNISGREKRSRGRSARRVK